MRYTVAALALFCATSANAQSAPFCLVNSGGTYCRYYDLPACQRDAAGSGGGCVVNSQRGAQTTITPPDTIGAAERGYRLGSEMGRASREARQAAEQQETSAQWLTFCQQMETQDIDELVRLAPSISQDEYTRLANAYLQRGDYCRALAR